MRISTKVQKKHENTKRINIYFVFSYQIRNFVEKRRRSAYTLIELIIVIGVLALLTGLASLSIVSYGQSADTETTQNIIRESLKQARANSLADTDEKAWGVHLESERLVIFADAGVGYNPADPSNATKVFANRTSASWNLTGGGDNVEFAIRTGKTSTDGTIAVTGSGQATKTISINSEGMVE